MNNPAEVRPGVYELPWELYVYGVCIPGATHVRTVAERINEAFKQHQEARTTAIIAGGCA